MRSYNESYLNDAMVNLGDMVEYAVCNLNFEPDVFFDYFISSGIADKFGKGNPKYIAGMSGVELVESVFRTVNISIKYCELTVNEFKGREYWAGWIFAYYQWYSGKRFEDLVRDGLTLSTVISMYILHEADVSKFVEETDKLIERNQSSRKSKLAIIRNARGFTQAQLSQETGIALRMIQLYEQKQNDINKAQVQSVLSLANTLGCSIEDLLE